MNEKATPDIVVRAARFEDVDEMALLLAELFHIERDFTPNPDKQRAGLRGILEQPDRWRVFVAQAGDKIVGLCSVHAHVSTAEGGWVGVIEDLIVRADQRGRGIGSRLLAAAEAHARAQGLLRLQLLADMDNPRTLDFYARREWAKTRLICLRRQGWRA